MKTFNLCFLGFGNVGRALLRLLLEKREALREEFGVEWRVTGVATRRMGWLAAPEGLDYAKLLAAEPGGGGASSPTDVRGWLRAARADVLFEVTSLEPLTGEPAVGHVRAALEAGAHVVTANKGAVVHAYRELTRLAGERGRRFLFEATVADMPVFSLFRETLPAARLLGFRGLFNSTTNLVLEMLERGGTLDEGVRAAQALGVAETDPSYDLDGWDTAVKVCALVNVLMDEPLKIEDVSREGVRGLDGPTVREARAAGRPFRLVGRARRETGGGVAATVRPEQVEPADALANAGGTSLTIHFELDVLPGLTVTAHGPDLRSTAYGLFADFVNLAR